jgi:triacylglycerol lipase
MIGDGGFADLGSQQSTDLAPSRWTPPVRDALVHDLNPASAGGFSPHFRQWLAGEGYSSTWARDDLSGGSFGGFTGTTPEELTHRPVIFVHGNGDRALGGPLGGWQKLRTYLVEEKGYGSAELYATTWGPADPDLAADQHHGAEWVIDLRLFIEAVVKYTSATQVDIIAHSMGVTLARKAILGGTLVDQPTKNLGPALTKDVFNFVAIAGANQGLVNCYPASSLYHVCNSKTGFFPGTWSATGVIGLASYLVDLNAQSGYEGQCRYDISSPIDEVIGYGGVVWGKSTAKLPAASQSFSFTLSHLGQRDETVKEVSELLAAPCGL